MPTRESAGSERGHLTGSVAHYRIVRRIGFGGMGDVYLAEDEILPRVVALKVMPEDVRDNDVRRQRFMREARAASALTHPNIAAIYEAGKSGDQLFIAMEYVEGESLANRIARGSLSVGEIVTIASQLADAVAAAHARGIVHRDIKPSNIMINGRGEVKVLDFGLAKFTDSELDGDIETQWKSQSGMVLGTAPYMSPEQALGKSADVRSDIFSVGSVLYELVTQRPAFAGSTVAETVYQVVNRQPESMARFNYDLPVELERVIRKCLEKDPARRYQAAGELLVDLRNLERDRQVAEHPHQQTALALPPLNRRRTTAWVAVLMLAAVTSILIWRSRQTGEEAPSIGSIAVLPFESHGESAAEYIADGLAETIIGDLAKLGRLHVMARSTSFRYRGADPIAAGRELRVDAVVTGRVQMTAGRIIATSELIDVRDGRRVAGARVDRPESAMANVAAAVTDEIARSLGIERARPAAAEAEPLSAEAFRLYIAARHEWNRRTPEGFGKALDLYRQAIEADSQFAPAYAGLADTYALLERYARVPLAESRSRAIAAAERAVELQPSLPEAHASLGSVAETYEWDWQRAEHEYRTAIRLSPSYATAHHWYAMLLARQRRFPEALAEIHLARELDPLSPVVTAAVANIHYYAGNYEESIAEARQAIRLGEQFAPARLQLSLSLGYAGRPADALRELEPIRRTAPEAAAVEALVRARAGETAAARAFLRQAEAGPGAASRGYVIAAVHALLGDSDEAMTWLFRASEIRSFWPLAYVAVDPAFTSLQNREDFRQLVVSLRGPKHE